MMYILIILALSLFLLILWFFLFPVRFVRSPIPPVPLIEPPDVFVYSYVLHIHTQFSYDSLGKPEDVIRTRDRYGIDYAIVTDHDNDHIKDFADERLIAGKEVKLNDENGNLLGDLLEVGRLKIIAHHFRGKYRWRLEKDSDYLIELINLRDALLERKITLIFYIFAGIILYPFLKGRIFGNYAKLINTELYAKKFLNENWKSRVVGGIDHHVKLYIREIGKRILVPDYGLSFSLMRNFLISGREIKTKEDLLSALGSELNLISFSNKPSFVWLERDRIKVYAPFSNTYVLLLSGEGEVRESVGSNVEFSELRKDRYLVLGYTYLLKVGRLLLGVKPLFVSDLLEVS